jgi:NADPH-dependent 2,4-dienoyl-CoA reductase/sulfur reductase-like enzyme
VSDVVVVGGGPAGMTAAVSLARGGKHVVLVDEQPELGGQYFRQASSAVVAAHGDHRPAGAALIAAVRAAGVDVRTSTTVWGVGDDGRTLLTATADSAAPIAAAAVLIATGAYERVLPFPGWQLPGVLTPGFAQHLALENVMPGRRLVVAGSGPFLLPVACRLAELGVQVIGVAEWGHPYRLTRKGLSVLEFPARLSELAGYLTTLARRRIPLWQDRMVGQARAGPDGKVAAVDLMVAGSDRIVASHEVDALCVGFGFRPQTELLSLLGVRMEIDERSGDRLPVHDAAGRCSQRVWVAGEAGGIGGVHAALARGKAAALSILEGANPGRAIRRQHLFTELTNQLYPSPGAIAASVAKTLPDGCQVCRCEAVTAGRIRQAASTANDPGALKAWTRAGMGPCQGRLCAPMAAALAGTPVPGTARMPIRPIPLAALAGIGGTG